MNKLSSNDDIKKYCPNIFNFMMKNRHKQDEIIKEITEQEQEELVDLTNANISVSSGESSPKNKLKNIYQYLKSSKKNSNRESNSSLPSETGNVGNLKSGKEKERKNSKYLNSSATKKLSDKSNSHTDIKTSEDNHITIDNLKQSNFQEEILKSCNAKCSLINESESFDIEETFKEEILECMSEDKKKNKKERKNKHSKASKVLPFNTQPSLTCENKSQSVSNTKFQNAFLQSLIDGESILKLKNHTKELKEHFKNNEDNIKPQQKTIKSFFTILQETNKQKEDILLKPLNGDLNSSKTSLENENATVFTTDLNSTCDNKMNSFNVLINNQMKNSSKSYEENVSKSCITSDSVVSISEEQNASKIRPVNKTCKKKNAFNLLFKSQVDVSNLNEFTSTNENKENTCLISSQRKRKSKVKSKTRKAAQFSEIDSDFEGTEAIENVKSKTRKTALFSDIDRDLEDAEAIDNAKSKTKKATLFSDIDSDFDDTEEIENAKSKPKFKSIIKESYMKVKSNINVEKENENEKKGSKEGNNNENIPRRSSRISKKISYLYSHFNMNLESDDDDIEIFITKSHSCPSNIKGTKPKKYCTQNTSQKSIKAKSSKSKRCISNSKKVKQCKRKSLVMDASESCESSNVESGDSDIEVISASAPPKNSDPQKMASIFVKKKSVVISPTKAKARSEFLSFKVEESVIKSSSFSVKEQELPRCPFPEFSHVKQECSSEAYWHLPEPEISAKYFRIVEERKSDFALGNEPFYSSNTRLKQKVTSNSTPLEPLPTLNTSTLYYILAYIKSKDVNFPVISIFNSYKKSKEEYIRIHNESSKDTSNKDKPNTDCLSIEQNQIDTKKMKRKKMGKSPRSNKRRKVSKGALECLENDGELTPIWSQRVPYDWTQVYAPKSAEYVIGNSGPLILLKDWLSNWKVETKGNSEKLMSRNLSEDSWDESRSETSEVSSLVNTMLITGPSGVGKTAMVYAVAQDFGFRVLEVNASSSRPGKQVLSQLSEATQSHNVSKNSQLFGSNDVDILMKNSEQVESTHSVSLILIEDIDIIFDEADEGFLSAVNTLMGTSKRPIVITTSIDCESFFTRIKERYLRINLEFPKAEMIAQHLQLMCLANGVSPSLKELKLLVKSNCEDIRSSILDLQLWVLSGTFQTHWWKIDNAKTLAKVLRNTNNSDTNIKVLFPGTCEISSKSVEIPISQGCIWNKNEAKLFRGDRPDNDSFLDWTLLSSNSVLFLPFNKKEKNRENKFPLKQNDTDLRNSHLLLKYNWLSLDETDEEPAKETKIIEEKKEPNVTAKKLRESHSRSINSLSNYFNTLADCDIFSHHLQKSQMGEGPSTHLNNHWWAPCIIPGLESIHRNSHSLCSGNTLDTISHISKSSVEIVQKKIGEELNSQGSEEEPSLCIETREEFKGPIFQPHQCSTSKYKLFNDELNKDFQSSLPLVSHLHRDSVVSDYLPYIRSIARVDHIGRSLKKFKLIRRYLKQLPHLGFDDVPGYKVIDYCNLFQS